MIPIIIISPYWIAVMAGIALLLAAVMNEISKNFVSLHVFIRKFKIFDLEFAATPLELSTYVNGIFSKEMPDDLSKKSYRSLKAFLILSIVCQVLIAVVFFFTCNAIAAFTFGIHSIFFLGLAWLQIISLVCGTVRVIFFLSYTRAGSTPLSAKRFKVNEVIEIIKWAIPLITGVVIISYFLFIWFSGNVNPQLLDIVMLLVAEIFIVFLVKKYLIKIKPVRVELLRDIGN